ncbi:hypothetical protein R16034_04874 [Ralstonia edaphis]|uniref:F5/8 type C domain-containing protein n=1 Tax=Ralstonia edaphi TaxID=3058599 RepID=A0AB72X820_9RALS|nr:hypothetical protein R16034_04874 [Ralstonia sp. LMG 6871]
MSHKNLTRTLSKQLAARAAAFTLLLSSFGFGLPAAVAMPTDPNTAALEARLREGRFFEEPLVTTGPSSIEEQQALWVAIQQYRDGGAAEFFGPLQAFLDQHPDSPWNLALRTNMGLTYYRLGYFSRAIDAWEAAWRDDRAQAQPDTKRLADRAFGELIRMHARIGHAERVNALLKEVEGRPLQGAATEAVAGAREGLWLMRNQPGTAYLCGPMAIRSILQFQGADVSRLAKIEAVRSSPHGVTLDTVGKLAKQLKLPYAIAKRSPGTPIPLPAVVHWKINHYAAIVGEQNGRYHVKDATFGNDLWISKDALESETSNYFLIPKQAAKQPGWTIVAQAEARKVFGMGNTTSVDDARTRPDDAKACDCKDSATPDTDTGAGDDAAAASGIGLGMPRYNVHGMVVSLNLVDTPVSYRPPKGPAINFTLTYNQREAYQPANFSYFNFGQKWTSNWLSYIQDDPTSPGTNVRRIVGGGGSVWESGSYNASTGAFGADSKDISVLVRASDTSYERRMRDGSKEIYGQSDGATAYPRRVFLTQIVDAQGNAVTLGYDNQLRLTSITDALGRQSILSYGNASNPLLVTRITDPFGRTAQIGYDASGRLSDITDAIGMKSSFSYDAGTFINAMTTPYGTTQFAYGENGVQRWINITDPLGQTERVEYRHAAPGLFYTEGEGVPSGMNTMNEWINYRNTFYWNAKAYAESAGDYTKARITHWLHVQNNLNVTGGGIESTKEPGETRIWYAYAGQTIAPTVAGPTEQPVSKGRLLENHSTELTTFTYNPQGNVTSTVDPLGVSMQYVYADNGIDLLTATRTDSSATKLVAQYTYNNQHQPLTYQDAAAKVTTYTYNAAGQKTSETNPLGNTRRWEYDNNGFLQRIVNAAGKTETSYTYDAVGRVASETDGEGFKRQYQYDALNRLTQIQYPDGSTRVFTWDKLDISSVTDQLGRTTTYTHDSARNLIQTVDPLGHVTQYDYYRNGKVKTVRDPNGAVTAWTYTPSGRLAGQSVMSANGTVQATSYLYDIAGRLSRITQPDGSYMVPQYDRAGRLIGSADTKGKNIAYTLDAMGNRTQEQVWGPSGNITRLINRVFDSMNRPLQVSTAGFASSSGGSDGPLVQLKPVGARASASYDATTTPDKAIDGDPNTRWTSPSWPPQWIEIDLGFEVSLRAIRMMNYQYPAGEDTNVITAGVSPNPTEVLKTITMAPADKEWINVQLDKPSAPVRYVRITGTVNPGWPTWYELEFYR